MAGCDTAGQSEGDEELHSVPGPVLVQLAPSRSSFAEKHVSTHVSADVSAEQDCTELTQGFQAIREICETGAAPLI